MLHHLVLHCSALYDVVCDLIIGWWFVKHRTLLSHVVLCSIWLDCILWFELYCISICCSILYVIVLHRIVLWCTVWYCVASCCIQFEYPASYCKDYVVLCCITSCVLCLTRCIVLCWFVGLHRFVLCCCVISCCIVVYSIALYGMVWYCIILPCISLYEML